MTIPIANQVLSRLEATFGAGRMWASPSGSSSKAWETPAFHLLWTDDVGSEEEIRRLWDARKGQ